MKKKSIIIFLSLLIIAAQVYSEETCIVSGTIRTPYDGDIYIGVYTLEGWQNINVKDKFPPHPYFQIIKITDDQVKAGKIPFKFESIKKGEYCIVAIQDKNKDKKLDRLLGGQIAEPSGLHVAPITWASWQEINFKLDKDMTDVDLVIIDSPYSKNQ
jgi:uncharacterized protein (DUF2141 family)